jgi:CDP-diacylglycerol---glycerol-3-phosphate 3-phosphatidyltransferase
MVRSRTVARRASLWPEQALSWALPVMAASGLLSGLSASLLLSRHRFLAGLSALGSGAALLAGTMLVRRDVGPARTRGRAPFAERILDVVFDASILVPLAWVMRAGSNWDAILAMVGLGAAYLASYQRAKGQSLGYAGSESLGYRVTREAILVLGLLTGWLAPALWAFTVVAVAAACVRVWNVVLQERHAAGVREGA